MLVVEEALRGGPADALLEPGDVLLTIDGSPLVAFVPLEEVLDEKVGGRVRLEVERRGAVQSVDVPVIDLHAITPSSYLEVGDSTLNDLSYQQARNHAIPLGGAYVASAGYMLDRAGIPNGAVIIEVAGAPIPDLDALETAIEQYPHGAEVPVRFFNVREPQRTQVATLILERMLFPMRRCGRPPEGGPWACTDAPPPPAATPREPRSTSFPPVSDKVAKRVQASLVSIRFDIPYRVEGVYGTRFHGTGLVVDADRGLVVTDRDTVPVALGDVRISVAGSVEIPARVVYLHPEHNIAVLRYDPTLLGDTPIVSAELWSKELDDGDPVWLVGISGGDELAVRRTMVDRVVPLYLPLPSPPFFSDRNIEVVVLGDATATSGGVLVDRKGRVLALWASFPSLNGSEPQASYYGIPIAMVQDVLPTIREGVEPTWRSLGLSLGAITIADARKRGLDESWADRLEAEGGSRRQVLVIGRRTVGTQAAEVVREGDLLLAVDGDPATSFRDVERASQRDQVALTVLRDGKAIDLDVRTAALDGQGTDRVLMWAGTVLHEPHAALPSQRGIPPVGVYLAWYWFGSPAGHYSLRPTNRIVAVDGKPTPDLDAFLAAVKDKPNRGTVMLKLVDLDGRPSVMTLVLDLQYWPTYEIRREPDGSWRRVDLATATAAAE
jgi:S1-C subfamily serine protease